MDWRAEFSPAKPPTSPRATTVTQMTPMMTRMIWKPSVTVTAFRPPMEVRAMMTTMASTAASVVFFMPRAFMMPTTAATWLPTMEIRAIIDRMALPVRRKRLP